MRKSYEKGAQPDKAGLRELLATDGREHLLPLVNVFARWRAERWIRSST